MILFMICFVFCERLDFKVRYIWVCFRNVVVEKVGLGIKVFFKRVLFIWEKFFCSNNRFMVVVF